jgi:hypothetical protein
MYELDRPVVDHIVTGFWDRCQHCEPGGHPACRNLGYWLV